MAVTRFEITARRPYFDGASFGDAGVYERIDGIVHFAIDPEHPANAEIVDLALAPRDADGRVAFDADFCILQPADPAKGTRRLLFDVSNRGNKPAALLFNSGVPPLDPSSDFPAANGFLMRHGWTFAWCGWQWDVPDHPAFLGLRAPEALRNGQPIPGQVCVEIVVNEKTRAVPLRDALGVAPFTPCAAADTHEPGARLTVQDHPNAPRTELPRASWRFARDDGGQPATDDGWLWRGGGFEPGRIYDLFYTTRRSPVVGTGLLAVRDFSSFLRAGAEADGNPCAGRIDRAHAFGISQSGRFLRTFLYHGLNLDEAGRQVFDGVMPHVAGGRRGEFNHRHAQPSVEVTPGFGHMAPFGDDAGTGLLARQRQLGGLPKVMYTNSSAEYWRGDALLVHVSPDGTRDLDLPEGVRAYMFTGTQHGAGIWPLMSSIPLPGADVATHWINAVDYRPLLRAALENLDRWVAEGVEPPASAVPRLADGSAVSRGAVLKQVSALPGAVIADEQALRSIRPLDLGPGAPEGIGHWPAEATGDPFPALVSALDADGNEVAGLRHPLLDAPPATYTGWNTRHASIGGTGQLARYLGSTIPFAATRQEREATGDPRPSLAERYATRDAYEAAIRSAVAASVGRRHLLAEDAEGTVHAAIRQFDAIAAGQPQYPA